MGIVAIHTADYAYLWGFAAQEAAVVVVRFRSGAESAVAPLNEAFVLLHEPSLEVAKVVAFDTGGRQLATCTLQKDGRLGDDC